MAVDDSGGINRTKLERLGDWLRAANRAMCVSLERSDFRSKGGPHMGFEADLIAENHAETHL